MLARSGLTRMNQTKKTGTKSTAVINVVAESGAAAYFFVRHRLINAPVDLLTSYMRMIDDETMMMEI